jgi:hypothetical protein
MAGNPGVWPEPGTRPEPIAEFSDGSFCCGGGVGRIEWPRAEAERLHETFGEEIFAALKDYMRANPSPRNWTARNQSRYLWDLWEIIREFARQLERLDELARARAKAQAEGLARAKARARARALKLARAVNREKTGHGVIRVVTDAELKEETFDERLAERHGRRNRPIDIWPR